MRSKLALCAVVLFVAACSSERSTGAPMELSSAKRASATADATESMVALGTAINAALEAQGTELRLSQIEWLGADAAGKEVFFNDRGNTRLGEDFVPGDPRRGGRTNITYAVDQTEGAVDGLTVAQTTAAIDRAMATWNAEPCSDLAMTSILLPPVDVGLVEFLSGLGGTPFLVSDVTHAGWLPPGFLDPSVIAATFTFVFGGPSGPTDIDGNGLPDVAGREILYNDRFFWRINGDIDVESIALHESGHGLSQGHFGQAFETGDGKLHFAPRAVMNAAYSGIQQQLTGTDNAGHCSNWGSWPNN